MGCCLSANADAEVPGTIQAHLYGDRQEKMMLGRWFPYDSSLTIAQPGPPVNPADPLFATSKSKWQGLELSHRWTSASVAVEVLIPADAQKGGEWGRKDAQWLNGALLSPGVEHLVSGREEVLCAVVTVSSAHPQAKKTAFTALSTGRMLLLSGPSDPAPHVLSAFHIFDLSALTAVQNGENWKVKLSFREAGAETNAGNAPGNAPTGQTASFTSLALEHVGSGELELDLTKTQAKELVQQVARLIGIFATRPLQTEIPEELRKKVMVPQAPCDGGFLSNYFATLSYLGVPLRQVNVGREFFSGVPLLELNISGMEITKQTAIAVRVGLGRAPCLRGFVCRGARGKEKKLTQEVLEELLPAFKQGTLLKVELAWCGLRGSQLVQLFDALCASGSCRTASLDLSGSEFDETAAARLASLIKAVPGGMRRFVLESCGLDRGTAATILASFHRNGVKLECLNLAHNSIGALPDPHPLAYIWKSKKMEVLNLNFTNLNVEKILETAAPSQVTNLRELKLVNCPFPSSKALVARFFGQLGNSIEEVQIEGFGSGPEKAELFKALAQKPSPSLVYTFSSGNYASLTKDLVEPLTLLEGRGLLGAGLSVGAAACAPQAAQMYKELCSVVADTFKGTLAGGLKGAEANADVWRKVAEKIRGKESSQSSVSTCMKLLQALKHVAVRRLQFLPEASSQSVEFLCLFNDGAVASRGFKTAAEVGFGPALALAVEGLSSNKEVWQLDVSNAMGGDSLALALGSMLKSNRTLQSLQVEGNCFTQLGWGAVRGALYGNKKLLEFPFPEKEAKAMVDVYQQFMAQKNNDVLSCRANIKRAYKSTKGRKTPHVMQTQEREVKNICAHKVAMSQARQAMEKFGTLQKEIQQAISRNQKESKSLEAQKKRNEKDSKPAWAAAGKAFRTIEGLMKQMRADQAANESTIWQKREALAKTWLGKKAALQKKGKDVKWLEAWLKANTKENKLVVTHQAAAGLLLGIPSSCSGDVRAEVKQTQDFIKLEEEYEGKKQLLNAQLAEQQLIIAEVQSSPNFVPPAAETAAASGGGSWFSSAKKGPALTPEQARQLQGAKLTTVKPPPLVLEAKVVGVGGPVQGAVVQGTVVKQSAAIQQAEYEQYQLYQKQQQQMNRRLQQQRQQQRDHDDYYDPGFAYLGLYQYHWHSQYHYGYHYGYEPYGYYGYGYHNHQDTWPYSPPHGFEAAQVENHGGECQFAQQFGAEEGQDCWAGMPDEPPEGMASEVSPEAVEEAAETVEMYAGGEDDHPGRGPHGGNWKTACPCSPPVPARLDLAEWFEEHICHAEEEARAVVLGRVGRLPYRREVLLRTGSKVREGPGMCLVTQCSLDRLDRLREQLTSWAGEVSAAVFIDAPPSSDAAVAARRGIREMCFEAATQLPVGTPAWTIVLLYRLEDEHVKCDAYDRLYPVNALRNAALEHARSDLVFLLDVDFVPSRRLHDLLLGKDAGRQLLNALSHGSRKNRGPGALVIPAFEAAKTSMTLPLDGGDLRAAVARREVEGFHLSHFPCGHRATDFDRWLGASKAGGSDAGSFNEAAHGIDAYLICYEEHFEPYVVVPRQAVPAYDERFRGYGLNKISHLYELSQRSFRFRTCAHADAFVVAAKHPKSQSWHLVLGPDAEAEQRARIATHYATFKAELKQKLHLTPPALPKSPHARSPLRRGLPQRRLAAGLLPQGEILPAGRATLAVA